MIQTFRVSFRAGVMALLAAVVVAGCSDSPTEPGTQTMADIEQAVHVQINQYRASKGLPPLTLNAAIVEQARGHSRNMAKGTTAFSHDGFDDRIDAIGRSIKVVSGAENVAFNAGFSDPATRAVEGWLNSTGHRENIEGDYNLTGIGVEKNSSGEFYFTQVFVRN